MAAAREWFKNSARSDRLGDDDSLAAKDTLYRGLDKLCEHKTDLFSFLKERWSLLFHASYEVLLYDLTSASFEGDVRQNPRKVGAGSVTAATNGRTVCRWSSRGWSAPKVFRWPMRRGRATRQTKPRGRISFDGARSRTAKRTGGGSGIGYPHGSGARTGSYPKNGDSERSVFVVG